MFTAESNKYVVLWIKTTFRKYAVDIAIPNKEAETIATAISSNGFAKLESLPIQMDRGKEFIN